MATQFKLAAMGHTMETGRVVEWHISEGESIDEGQLLISIETDKTVVDVNSPVSGVPVSYTHLTLPTILLV